MTSTNGSGNPASRTTQHAETLAEIDAVAARLDDLAAEIRSIREQAARLIGEGDQ